MFGMLQNDYDWKTIARSHQPLYLPYALGTRAGHLLAVPGLYRQFLLGQLPRRVVPILQAHSTSSPKPPRNIDGLSKNQTRNLCCLDNPVILPERPSSPCHIKRVTAIGKKFAWKSMAAWLGWHKEAGGCKYACTQAGACRTSDQEIRPV